MMAAFMNKVSILFLLSLLATVVVLTESALEFPARPQADSFFKGKTIKLVVGSTAGSF